MGIRVGAVEEDMSNVTPVLELETMRPHNGKLLLPGLLIDRVITHHIVQVLMVHFTWILRITVNLPCVNGDTRLEIVFVGQLVGIHIHQIIVA
jgi:hypothetical protein